MPVVAANDLVGFATRIFEAWNVKERVAQTVARSLVLSNLKGHDSHGVIRIASYIEWMERNWIDPDAELQIVEERPCVLITDGHFGFGQLIGRQATERAIEKTSDEGSCILTIRRSGHLGRIGEFVEMAAEARLVCLSLTNTHGGGMLVAPHGGRERRLSANPVAGGAPLSGEGPLSAALISDLSTSTVAEGKIRVARDKGDRMPPGAILDSRGEPSVNPNDFYADPPGVLLPMAGHKGYALSLLAEILAGAISGAGCSRAGSRRVANGWFALFLDPDHFCGRSFFDEQVGELARWVKSSQLREGFHEILLPGEPEARIHEERIRKGVPIDQVTWNTLVAVAARRGIPAVETDQ